MLLDKLQYFSNLNHCLAKITEFYENLCIQYLSFDLKLKEIMVRGEFRETLYISVSLRILTLLDHSLDLHNPYKTNLSI